MIEAYRPHSSRYQANSGKGAALGGGRWNRVGIEAIDTAQSRSLAAIEILANYSVLPKDFVLTPVRIPDLLIRGIPPLPPDWQTNKDATREIGTALLAHFLTSDDDDAVIDLSCAAVLSVPSSIIPAEQLRAEPKASAIQ